MPLHRRRLRWFAAVSALYLVWPSAPALGQSLTAGALKGQIRGVDGAGIAAAQLTIESRAGGSHLELESAADGSFQLPLVAPGDYSILVERGGYQPVRRLGVLIAPGRLTSVTVEIVKRPPPITTVEEQTGSTAVAGITQGRLISDDELNTLDRRRDVADAARGATQVVAPADGREGFAIAASGLPVTMSRFLVDGVLETMLRHPGLKDEPARTPLFQRDGVDQAEIIGVPLDAEWRGTQGSIFAVQTRRGSNRLQFRPYASFGSAKLGGRALDNPGDSTASSFQAGAVITGALVPDTAHFLLRFDYQSLEQPSPRPWQRDSANFGNQVVSLQAALPTIANDNFGTVIGGLVGGPVRSYKGGSGFGRIDGRFKTSTASARVGFASWKERGWAFGDELASGAGSALQARDGSVAVSVTSATEIQANEFRAGFNMARRDYRGTTIPNSTIIANGAGFGNPLALPGLFDTRVVDLSDAFQRQLGGHRLKVGANATFVSYRQDYRFGSGGAFAFGDLTGFGLGRGSFVQVSGPTETAQFTTNEVGIFAQDTWTITPEIQLVFGVRYEVQRLPRGKIQPNASWQTLTGIRNDSIPRDRRGFSPKVGFVWDVQNRGEWIVRGGGGISAGRMDPSTLAEAILFDRDVRVRRGIGDFTSWPNTPDPTQAPDVGQRLTVINNNSYRHPRSSKFEFGVSRQLSGAQFHLAASYQHTDFLLRRQDLNRAVSSGTTQEGRPVYGSLVQRAGLVLPAVGTNRRFSDFDLVSGLSPTGFADYYEVSATLERRVAERLSVIASYTYSKTTDNLVGARSADPTDQLTPFPEGLNGADWTKGRSDFDVPHRGAVTLRYRSVGTSPLVLAARYRVRSGLAYTAGFRPGVDVNGDGSGNNDPAFLNGSLSGLAEVLGAGRCGGVTGGFAIRNGCQQELSQALDLHLSFGLPIGPSGDRLALKVDAFNVVATASGVVDRALILINPSGTLSIDGAGNVTLPLIANPNFGSLLVRRGEPRMVRVGLSLEY